MIPKIKNNRLALNNILTIFRNCKRVNCNRKLLTREIIFYGWTQKFVNKLSILGIKSWFSPLLIILKEYNKTILRYNNLIFENGDNIIIIDIIIISWFFSSTSLKYNLMVCKR